MEGTVQGETAWFPRYGGGCRAGRGLYSSTFQTNLSRFVTLDSNHPMHNTKSAHFKLSVGGTSPSYLLEIKGLFTQGSRPGRTVGESVGGIIEMYSSDWSNGIRYHIFDTRPDTEFKQKSGRV